MNARRLFTMAGMPKSRGAHVFRQWNVLPMTQRLKEAAMQAGRSLVVAGAVTAAGNVPGCAMSPPHAGGLARAEPQDGNNAWHYAATTEGEFSMARRPNTLRELL